MIPWLLVAELLSVKEQTLSSMVKDRITAYPSSGEINSKLRDPKAAISAVLNTYKNDAVYLMKQMVFHWSLKIVMANGVLICVRLIQSLL